MRNKIIGTICLALGIIIIVSTSTSFAFFTATTDGTGDNITGTIANFDINLELEELYTTNKLVPLEDDLITTAVNNNCIDKHGYKVCALYKITLTNSGDPQILNGYITTSEETTYITDHLKAQLFSSDLTRTISNPLTITDNEEINTEEKRYFHIDETNLYSIDVTNNETLYLALWLTETNTQQDEDYDKKYFGKVAFESTTGDIISASFK